MIDVNKLRSYRDDLKKRTFRYGGSTDLLLLEDTVRTIEEYLDGLCTEDDLLLELSSTCIPNDNESDWLCSTNTEIDEDKCIKCWKRHLK